MTDNFAEIRKTIRVAKKPIRFENLQLYATFSVDEEGSELFVKRSESKAWSLQKLEQRTLEPSTAVHQIIW